MNTLAAIVVAYLLGSISFAVVVSRVMGMADPRSYGSGNPGATNVLRSGNKLAAILTLVGDCAKGWLAVFLAMHFAQRLNLSDGAIGAVALAAFVGHLWPVFFRFKGGKGVATALGVLLGVNPWLGLGVLASWLAMAVIFRYSSLAALTASVLAPFYYAFIFGVDGMLIAIVVMSALLVWRHAGNIAKLFAGKESKIGSKAKGADPVTKARRGH